MKDPFLILGIESSCDETAAAIVRSDGTILSSEIASQMEVHAAHGGVVPEIAARAHLDAVDQVVAAALRTADVSIRDIDAVAATGGHGPDNEPSRDLVLRPGEEPVWIERAREPGPGIRGSGCRFATSLACGLARGEDLVEAATAAGDYVARRIREGEEEPARGDS